MYIGKREYALAICYVTNHVRFVQILRWLNIKNNKSMKEEDLIKMAKVEIRSERCKSCLYCIKFCPKDVLAVGEKVNSKGYEYVVPVNMDACIGCAMCARICPDGAIDVYR